MSKQRFERKFGWSPRCCEQSIYEAGVRWTEGNSINGPEYDSFAIRVMGADDYVITVTHCPFCGKTLSQFAFPPVDR